jgi:hypothetical protein
MYSFYGSQAVEAVQKQFLQSNKQNRFCVSNLVSPDSNFRESITTNRGERRLRGREVGKGVSAIQAKVRGGLKQSGGLVHFIQRQQQWQRAHQQQHRHACSRGPQEPPKSNFISCYLIQSVTVGTSND